MRGLAALVLLALTLGTNALERALGRRARAASPDEADRVAGELHLHAGRLLLHGALAFTGGTLLRMPGAWTGWDDGLALLAVLALWGLVLRGLAGSARAFAGLNRGGLDEVRIRRLAAAVDGVAAVSRVRMRRTGDDLHVYVAVVARPGEGSEGLGRRVRDAVLEALDGVRQVIVYVQDPLGGSASTEGDRQPEEPFAEDGTPLLPLIAAPLAALGATIWLALVGGLPSAPPVGHDRLVLAWLLLPLFLGLLPDDGSDERPARRSAVVLVGALPLMALAAGLLPPWAALLAALALLAGADALLPGGPLFDPRPRGLPRTLSLVAALLLPLGLACRGPLADVATWTLLLGGATERLVLAAIWILALAAGLASPLVPLAPTTRRRLRQVLAGAGGLLLGGVPTAILAPAIVQAKANRLAGDRPRLAAGAIAAVFAAAGAALALRLALPPACLVLPLWAIIPGRRATDEHGESRAP